MLFSNLIPAFVVKKKIKKLYFIFIELSWKVLKGAYFDHSNLKYPIQVKH